MTAAGFLVKDEETKKISNPRNLKPHSFRHSLNTLLRDFGYDAGKIRASLGWSNEAVQEGYTDWDSMNFVGQREIVEKELG